MRPMREEAALAGRAQAVGMGSLDADPPSVRGAFGLLESDMRSIDVVCSFGGAIYGPCYFRTLVMHRSMVVGRKARRVWGTRSVAVLWEISVTATRTPCNRGNIGRLGQCESYW